MTRSTRRRTQPGALYSALRAIARWIPPSILRVKAVDLVVLPRQRWRPPNEDEAFRWATADDTDRLEELSFRPPGVAARFARGGRAMILEENDQIVGCIWFEPSAPLYEHWLQFILTRTEMWLSDIYVAPSHRGEGIANRLGHHGRARLPRDVTAVVGVTTFLNSSARRAAEKSGYDITRISYVRVLGVSAVKLPGRLRFGWWGRHRPLRLILAEITTPR